MWQFITFDVMRTILLWCTMLFTVQFVNGQTSFTVSDTRISSSAPANTFAFYKWAVVSNNTSQDIDMRWSIVEETIPAGWVALVEDLDSAYLTHTDSADFVLPAVAGQSDLMIVSFQPNNVVGTGRVVLDLRAVNDPTDSVLLTYNATATMPVVDTNTIDTTTAVTDVELLEWLFYPNPTKGDVLLQSSMQIRSVALFSLNGQLITTEQVYSSEHVLSLFGLAKGTYLMHITWANGSSDIELIQLH